MRGREGGPGCVSAAVGLCAPGSASLWHSSAKTGSMLACRGGHPGVEVAALGPDFGQISSSVIPSSL